MKLCPPPLRGWHKKGDIQLVSATSGPGLIGSLLVGYNYAKAFDISRKSDFWA